MESRKKKRVSQYKPIYPSVNPLVAKLAKVRLEKSVTLAELEKNAGVSHSSFGNWLLNGREPLLGNFEAVANYLGYELLLVERK